MKLWIGILVGVVLISLFIVDVVRLERERRDSFMKWCMLEQEDNYKDVERACYYLYHNWRIK